MFDLAFASHIIIQNAGNLAAGSIPNGSTARLLLGLTTAFDGRGGWFVWDANCVTPDDGDSFIAIVGQATGRYRRVSMG